MDPRIENYISEKKRIQKERFLISHDLTERIFRDNSDNADFPTDEFPNYGKIPGTDKFGYYKEVPISISDEDYEELVKLEKNSPAKSIKNTKNGIATAITIFSYFVILISAIVGLILVSSVKENGWLLMIYFWAGGALSGTLLLGFAEVINLLQKLVDNQK